MKEKWETTENQKKDNTYHFLVYSVGPLTITYVIVCRHKQIEVNVPIVYAPTQKQIASGHFSMIFMFI